MRPEKALAGLSPDLVAKIIESSTFVEVPKNTEVMREGQYVKAVPIVTDGLIKVFTRKEEKEMLLYYIRPGESCIMSFDACLKNTPSQIYASTEENSTVLLLPVNKVFVWMREYQEMNSLFFQQYNIRYNELIVMINQLLFEKMDKRVYRYLKTKLNLSGKNSLKISHQKIANDLGTAREVISRILKKLENEGKVALGQKGIKIN